MDHAAHGGLVMFICATIAPMRGAMHSPEPPRGYRIENAAGSRAHVYLARRQHDERPVVLKYYTRGSADRRRERAQREYDAVVSAAGPGVVTALEVSLETQSPVLVLDRAPGRPLSASLSTPLPLAVALEIARGVANALAIVHAARVLHHAVAPENVVLDPSTGRVTLIDFGRAQRFGEAAPSGDALIRRRVQSATPLYMAPEQTGRMGRDCDVRTDLYGLGATLYHALTGRPPFPLDDLLELVHAQIARVPPSARELRADLPEPIARLVSKLLAKEPDERYQTARGLAADLELAQRVLRDHGSIPRDLPLGRSELPSEPRFRSRLYGRAGELERIVDRGGVGNEGALRLVAIEGPAGVGKSALIDEACRVLASHEAHLAQARFDARESEPHAAWKQMLGELVQRVLSAPEDKLLLWSERVATALGGIARALVPLVPDLELLLHEIDPVPALGPRETRARLALACRRFIRTFGEAPGGLVLTIDDLSHSDGDTLQLLEDVLSGDAIPGVSVIVGRRIAADDPSDPAGACLDRITERQVSVERIALSGLPESACRELLADALERTEHDTLAIAHWLAKTTRGNPREIRQVVEQMSDQQLLSYEPGLGWVWDEAVTESADALPSQGEWIEHKVSRLSAAARRALRVSSCIGREFAPDLLARVAELDPNAAGSAIDELCAARIVAACPSGLRFVSEHVQSFANGTLAPYERARIHHALGCALLAGLEAEEHAAGPDRDRRLFEILDHFDEGAAHLCPEAAESPDSDAPESGGGATRHAAVTLGAEVALEDLLRLSLEAGTRALESGAAERAHASFGFGVRLLSEHHWETIPDLAFEIAIGRASTAFQTRRHEESLDRLDELEGRPLGRMERARVAVQRVLVLSFATSADDCVAYSLAQLRGFGVRWPARPSRLRALWVTRKLRKRIRRLDEENVFRPATNIDHGWLAPLALLAPSGASMIRVDIHLAMLASAYAVDLYLGHGFVSRPGFTLANHAHFAFLLLGDAGYARHCAGMATHWNRRVPDPLYNARTEVVLQALLAPWLEPRRDALAPLTGVGDRALEFGDLEFSMYSRFLCCFLRALGGAPVGETYAEFESLSAFVRRSGHYYPEAPSSERVYRKLLHDGDDREAEREGSARTPAIDDLPDSVQPYIRTLQAMVDCIAGHFDRAFLESEVLGARLNRVVPFVHVADHTFYRGLAAAALAEGGGRVRTHRLRRALRAARRRMRRHAQAGPDFRHMVQILDAEHARLAGNAMRARVLYEAAARAAMTQGFVHHAALAYERLSDHLERLRRGNEATDCLRRAQRLYRDWGAHAKATALAARSS